MPGPEVATCSSRPNGPPVVYEYMTNTNEKMPAFFAADFSAWFLASATGGGIVQWADVTRSCVDVQAAAADGVTFKNSNRPTCPVGSEFTRMFFGPAFDDDFLVGVELDGVASLAMHVAEEAVLPSTEGEVGHGCGYADVDADVSGRGFIAESARGRTARCEKRSLIAEGILVEEGHRFVQILRVNQAQHWAENFRVREFAFDGDAVQNRRLYEVSRLVAGDFRVAAIYQNLGALFFAFIY